MAGSPCQGPVPAALFSPAVDFLQEAVFVPAAVFPPAGAPAACQVRVKDRFFFPVPGPDG